MRPIVSFALGVVAALSLLASGALAATKTPPHHPHLVVYVDPRPPLDVNKRSWLDPGPVVQPGTMPSYMTENTIFNQTPDEVNYRSRFGNETLPRRFDLPGRREPLVDFWTPGSPD
jgi:hypothetical protein